MAQPDPTAAAGRSAGRGVLLAACVSALVVNANDTSKGSPGLQLPSNQQPPGPITIRSTSTPACPIDGRRPMRTSAYTLSIVIGSLLIIGGVAT
jgi:hypothetical protein